MAPTRFLLDTEMKVKQYNKKLKQEEKYYIREYYV